MSAKHPSLKFEELQTDSVLEQILRPLYVHLSPSTLLFILTSISVTC
jgi:hypothetical protein